MTSRDEDQELFNVMDALAESVLSLSDEELLEEAKAEGQDPAQIAQGMEEMLLAGVREHFRTKRESFQRDEKLSLSASKKLPESSKERRNLLERVLERLPKLSPKLALTYQCRNLSELTDEDVASSLEDLQILGAIEALQEDDLE
ncbi:MAG: hypothetical protein KC800_07295 [Candidatus Eremiobacteraeota bacterium]|nr:hypothetical protein [Candidatus Eremiobacteraeota bacterium]